jgi:hypothetical protein
MNNITLTMCNVVDQCGECGRVPEHLYQFSLSGHDILLCGQCIAMLVAQITFVRQKEEPQLVAKPITEHIETVSDQRCSRCLDMLAAHLTIYRNRGEGQRRGLHG